MEGKNMAHRTRQNCLGYVLNIYDHHGNTAQLFPRTFQLENPNIFKCLAEKFNELGYELQPLWRNVCGGKNIFMISTSPGLRMMVLGPIKWAGMYFPKGPQSKS